MGEKCEKGQLEINKIFFLLQWKFSPKDYKNDNGLSQGWVQELFL